MATLVCRWKLDEGSGTTCYDAISGDDMIRNVVSGYPEYVSGKDGPYALSFSGADGRFGPTYDVPWATNDMCYIAPADRSAGCGSSWSMTAWIKTAVSASGRPIFGAFSYRPNNQDAIGAPHDCLYLGDDGKAYLYVQHRQIATRYTVAVGSTSAVDDDVWHFVVGTYEYSLPTATGTLKIYVDGSHSGTTTTTYSYDVGPMSAGGQALVIGAGFLLETTSSLYLPAAWQGKAYGTFDGIIDDCRLYCGALTAQEVLDLYAPRPANALMFSCNT